MVGVRSSTIGSIDREKNGAEAGFKSFPLRLNAFVPEGFLTGRLGCPSAAASAEKCDWSEIQRRGGVKGRLLAGGREHRASLQIRAFQLHKR